MCTKMYSRLVGTFYTLPTYSLLVQFLEVVRDFVFGFCFPIFFYCRQNAPMNEDMHGDHHWCRHHMYLIVLGRLNHPVLLSPRVNKIGQGVVVGAFVWKPAFLKQLSIVLGVSSLQALHKIHRTAALIECSV